MKTYRVNSHYKGIQHSAMVVTISQKRAAQITGVSEHTLRNQGSSTIHNPELEPDTHYVVVQKSGENPFIFSEQEIGVPMPYSEFKSKVDTHRGMCPTHRDTLLKCARQMQTT